MTLGIMRKNKKDCGQERKVGSHFNNPDKNLDQILTTGEQVKILGTSINSISGRNS